MPEQEELFKSDTSWVHVFRSLFLSGEAAKLGPYAVSVYLSIKVFVSFSTGMAFPSLETICEKTGISKRKVIESIKLLEENGYLVKRKEWKSNTYELREKVQFDDQEGNAVAVATWQYIPQLVEAARAELKSFRLTGEDQRFNIINIERLVIENPVVLNVAGDIINLNLDGIKDDKLRERLRAAVEKVTRPSPT